MLFAIDIGNTNVVFGLYEHKKLIFDWRISTDKNKTSDEYGLIFKQVYDFAKIKPKDIEATIICSVVPNLESTFKRAIERYLDQKPIIIDKDTKMNISNGYEYPGEVGADRLVNACAVIDKFGGPAIIVDIGTAISIDFIDEKGCYLGGAIAPGLGISSEALFLKTAKLPKIDLDVPKSVIGKNTRDSIQSGMVFGFIALIDGIIEKMLKERNLKPEDVQIIGTGGYSLLIANNSQYIAHVDKMITLDGLALLYELNK